MQVSRENVNVVEKNRFVSLANVRVSPANVHVFSANVQVCLADVHVLPTNVCVCLPDTDAVGAELGVFPSDPGSIPVKFGFVVPDRDVLASDFSVCAALRTFRSEILGVTPQNAGASSHDGSFEGCERMDEHAVAGSCPPRRPSRVPKCLETRPHLRAPGNFSFRDDAIR